MIKLKLLTIYIFLLYIHLLPAQAADIDLTCIYLKEQLVLRNASKNNHYILTDGAFKNNKCPSKIYYPTQKAVETAVRGWSVLHDKNEDIGSIIEMADNNRKIFLTKYSEKHNEKNENMNVSFGGVNLHALSILVNDICGIHIGLKHKINQGVWLESMTSISTKEFCLSVPTIYSVYGIEFALVRGVLGVSGIQGIKPNKSLNQIGAKNAPPG